jgi:hypothetical protein
LRIHNVQLGERVNRRLRDYDQNALSAQASEENENEEDRDQERKIDACGQDLVASYLLVATGLCCGISKQIELQELLTSETEERHPSFTARKSEVTVQSERFSVPSLKKLEVIKKNGESVCSRQGNTIKKQAMSWRRRSCCACISEE